jgi:hypothetical protein
MCLLIFAVLTSRSCHGVGTGDVKTPADAEAPLALGVWGGDHVRIEVLDAEVAIEFDCAHGSLPLRPQLDEEGRFRSDGFYTAEKPGPSREGETGERPARFDGTVDGRKLSLMITLTDTKETLGPFTLTHGMETRLTKCL